MKKQILKSIIAAGFLVLFAAVSARAQTNNQVVANIPFDFYVKNQKFTAGEYVIERANPASLQAALIFRRKDDGNSQIVMMLPLSVNAQTRQAQPNLIFNRYESDYFLSEFRNPADSFGAQLPKAKKERNLAKQLGEPKREVVVLSTSNQR